MRSRCDDGRDARDARSTRSGRGPDPHRALRPGGLRGKIVTLVRSISRNPGATGDRPADAPPSLERIEHVMGMPVIVEVCDAGFDAGVLDRLFAWLRFVDETFSTYREDSEISRLNRGEISLAETHASVQSVLSQCESLRLRTNGYFVAAAPMAALGGGIDPSGLVKG